jgi:hypothetical protein
LEKSGSALGFQNTAEPDQRNHAAQNRIVEPFLSMFGKSGFSTEGSKGKRRRLPRPPLPAKHPAHKRFVRQFDSA